MCNIKEINEIENITLDYHYNFNTERYNKAISTFGMSTQLVIVMEELAELIQQISKFYRFIKFGQSFNTNNLLSEIVDSRLMIDELIYILKKVFNQITLDTLYKEQLYYKLNRFDKRIEVSKL